MLTWAFSREPLLALAWSQTCCRRPVPTVCPCVSLRAPGIAHHTDPQHRHRHCGPPCLSGESNECSPQRKTMLTMTDRFKVCPGDTAQSWPRMRAMLTDDVVQVSSASPWTICTPSRHSSATSERTSRQKTASLSLLMLAAPSGQCL
jgi:hypothetical protein